MKHGKKHGQRSFSRGFWQTGCTEIFECISYYMGKSLILIFTTASVAQGGLGLTAAQGAALQSLFIAFAFFGASGRRSDNRPLAGCEICDTNWYGAGRNRILVRLYGKICDACICHDLFRVCRAEPVSSQCDAGADRG